ncbi:hypothetical protein JCM19238_4017 [Vibrio ponticus]|nr:hypothetical protein JCM19238_4017 [Vibrio ponticus]
MKWIFALLLLVSVSFTSGNVIANDALLQNAFKTQQSDLQIQGSGKVIRLLPDDNLGSRHQKFIIRLQNKQTLLVAHNIDLAPRIDNLNIGDRLEFYGEYEWNKKGGVIHWTHHDPANQHPHGWLKHLGRIYQ